MNERRNVPRAVPQQAHVLDRVRAGDHPRDQARDLQVRIDATSLDRVDVLLDEPVQARPRTGARPAHDTRFGSSNTAVTS